MLDGEAGRAPEAPGCGEPRDLEGLTVAASGRPPGAGDVLAGRGDVAVLRRRHGKQRELDDGRAGLRGGALIRHVSRVRRRADVPLMRG